MPSAARPSARRSVAAGADVDPGSGRDTDARTITGYCARLGDGASGASSATFAGPGGGTAPEPRPAPYSNATAVPATATAPTRAQWTPRLHRNTDSALAGACRAGRRSAGAGVRVLLILVPRCPAGRTARVRRAWLIDVAARLLPRSRGEQHADFRVGD